MITINDRRADQLLVGSTCSQHLIGSDSSQFFVRSAGSQLLDGNACGWSERLAELILQLSDRLITLSDHN